MSWLANVVARLKERRRKRRGPAALLPESVTQHLLQSELANLRAEIGRAMPGNPAAHGYRLVACSLAGTNAFFAEAGEAGAFEAYPAERLCQPPRYHLCEIVAGHKPTMKWLNDALA